MCLCWCLRFMPGSFLDKLLSNLLKSIVKKKMKELVSQSHVNALKEGKNFTNFNSLVKIFLGFFIIIEKEGTDALNNFCCLLFDTYLDLLQNCSRSISLTKGMFDLIEFAERVNSKESTWFNSCFLPVIKQIEVIEVLSSVLSTPSYWLRMHALRILVYCAPTIDAIENSSTSNLSSEQFEVVAAEVCQIFNLCFALASITPSLENDREYARLASRIEVIVRNGLLPPTHVLAVCSFCLSMLHCKFKLFWEPVLKILTTAINNDVLEEKIWSIVIRQIESLTYLPELSPKAEISESMSYFETRSFYLNEINRSDDGEWQIESSISSSFIFPYKVETDGLVHHDARTDTHVALSLVLDLLKRSPVITLRRSRHVVPIFFRFLKEQYYAVISDDPEIPEIIRDGIFTIPELNEPNSSGRPACQLSRKILKGRIILFLEIFSLVSSPKQLYMHQLLYRFYCIILSKPDLAISKLALDCILTYKPPGISPYQDSLKRLLSDKSFREEMLVFDASTSGDTVDPSHRNELSPILTSIAYSRFASHYSKGSRSAREQAITR